MHSEYAWLIEMSDGGQPTYWCRLDDEDGVCGWSNDHDKAIRFRRASDAQAIIDENGWTEPKPVEHAWDHIPATDGSVTLSLVERLRKWHTPGETITGDVQLYLDAADEIDRITRERDEVREALTDIAVYGCGMLNQPEAMNAPEEVWLRKRIREYERVARAALNKDTTNG